MHSLASISYRGVCHVICQGQSRFRLFTLGPVVRAFPAPRRHFRAATMAILLFGSTRSVGCTVQRRLHIAVTSMQKLLRYSPTF